MEEKEEEEEEEEMGGRGSGKRLLLVCVRGWFNGWRGLCGGGWVGGRKG